MKEQVRKQLKETKEILEIVNESTQLLSTTLKDDEVLKKYAIDIVKLSLEILGNFGMGIQTE